MKPLKPKGRHDATVVKIHTAKTTLSKLIVRALGGERVVIARNELPVVELVPVRAPADAAGRTRRFGALRGAVAVGPAFFEPLPPEELGAWGG